MPLKFNQPIPDLKEYAAYFNHCNNSKKYILEASPSYLYGNEKIGDVLQEKLPGVKLIVILRNPTERLYSFYESVMINGMLPGNDSFRNFVEQSISFTGQKDLPKTIDNEFYLRGVEEGIYLNYIPYWLNSFNSTNLKILFFEDLKKDTPLFMKEICEWLNIDFSIYKPDDFKIDNKTTTYKAGGLHHFVFKLYNRMESFWRKNVRLKRVLRSMYKFINASSKQNKLSNEDRNFVDSYYLKYNSELKNLLLKSGFKNLPDWLLKAE